MTSAEKIEKYLKRISKSTCPKDYNAGLHLFSEVWNDEIKFRADIGYVWTGTWSDSIQEALDGLVQELIRVGEIEE